MSPAPPSPCPVRPTVVRLLLCSGFEPREFPCDLKPWRKPFWSLTLRLRFMSVCDVMGADFTGRCKLPLGSVMRFPCYVTHLGNFLIGCCGAVIQPHQ